MFTILGSLIGLFGSAIPSVIDLFSKKDEGKKEIELAKLAGGENKDILLAVKELRKSVETTPKTDTEHFSEKVRSLVRPAITMSFLILFLTFKGYLMFHAFSLTGFSIEEFSTIIWDDKTSAIFATIISYYFGSRAIDKMKK